MNFNRLIVFFILLCISYCGYGQSRLKFWDEGSPLEWKDFMGTPENEPAHSKTYSGSHYSFVKLDTGIYRFSFTTTAVFDMSYSWVKENQKTSYLLKHEQLHFDISEIFTRKLLKSLSEAIYSKKYKEEMNAIYLQNKNDRVRMQDLYDKETSHGQLVKEQLEWEQYVATLLLGTK